MARPLRLTLMALTALGVCGAYRGAAHDRPAPRMAALADEYLAVNRIADGGVFPIRDAAALGALYLAQDRLLEKLSAVDRGRLAALERIEHSILTERLQSQRALRVCHAERWDLNHLTGWQIRLPQEAAAMPLASAQDREQALRRWASLPAYLDADIANLKMGLASGYSVPRSVVMRVSRQIDALRETLPAADGPFNVRAMQSSDADFRNAWHSLMSEAIAASLQRFAAFLREEYLPHARDTLGLWDLPHGHDCYAAFLRRETTLPVSADATFELGQATVTRSAQELQRIGAKLFDATVDVPQILQRAKQAPANHFEVAAAIISYANETLARSTRLSAAYFFKLPQQPVEIQPLPSYQQGSGISSHYEASDSVQQAAVYRINLDDWQEQTRGAVAVTAVHEGIPGHHLQREAARATPLSRSVAQLAYNSAYVEGWANYVEQLCEEIGVYDTPYSAIFRRSVRGQSLMIDPAIHERRWDRATLRTYLQALGETEQQADDVIDRIAVQPAQLTSYDTGGLEILSLREHAKQSLGSRFDIREFHAQVLVNGAVPLTTLREHIEAWIRSVASK